ncbi:MAG: SCY1-like protein 1 [Bacillariaceae sp.]|jgi:SCY1-like protein 1
MLVPLFFIEEHFQEPDKVGDELSPLVAKLFLVPDRGVRSVLLNQVGFFTKNLNKNALNSSVFEPLCSGFNDSSPVLRELTLKATHALLPSLHPPNVEKLSRYLVRLQSDAESSLRTNAVIFIAKIAPHLSEVSKQKMLLPAYVRSMKDPFSPCRLSALKSTMMSKTLFTKQDLATKVMPSVMPLLLDPMTDVRQEAFRVVRELLEDVQQESNRMTELGDPLMIGAPGTAPTGGAPQRSRPQQSGTTPTTGVAPSTTARTTSAASTNSNSSSGYLGGISSWMGSSTAPAPVVVNPIASTSAPTSTARPITVPQPPIQQFAAASLNAPAPAPAADDGWGDEGDDNWSDDDDDNDNALAFSNIGGGNQTIKPSTTTNNASSMGDFGGGMGMDDDPFASLGMKTAAIVKPRVGASKGKLVLPKKKPPAKKLTIDKNDVGDGWDDF